MEFPFDWNDLADQPHNVAPRRERMRHHLRRIPGYLRLAGANVKVLLPALGLYRRYRRRQHLEPSDIGRACGLAVSPVPGAEDEVIRLLRLTGARETLVRVASWERDKLGGTARFLERLKAEGFGLTAALLQRREDVLRPAGWRAFLKDAFDRLGGIAERFEVGHAWNRTKWGVWDFEEYLALAESAFDAASARGIRLVGPAVIDFEFHLYPPLLARLPFDKVSSLLYVDRVGAPENAQAGWTTAAKVALLKAAVDVSATGGRGLWVTEVNWPLKGMGPYSPASGQPNVSEENQADYLVRYFVLCLAGGFVERVYWWQLAAPGYGLVNSLENPWRLRPSYHAFQTLVRHVDGSRFLGRSADGGGHVFHFQKEGRSFAVCWSSGRSVRRRFDREVRAVLDRGGREIGFVGREITLDGSPLYVHFG
ncbi:MAG: hypothetical protein JW747_05450 [Candidatus Aminicenantes bacterium]|nr:hypothetical protein [Candidatus Aminicenantes bacterium]